MTLRVVLGVCFLVLAVEEFLRTGSAAAELVRRPGDLVDAILSGDGSVGPWLLSAYGLLLIARGFGHRRS